MLLWLANAAMGGGTTPEDRVEVFADTGVMTGQVAILFGVGGGLRKGPFAALGTVGFGGRDDWLQAGASQRPSFGLGSLTLVLDAPTGDIRLGPALILDAALLDYREEDCGGGSGCRHQFFVGADVPPELGLAGQPAAGLRLMGTGASGAAFALQLGVQPILQYDTYLPLTPRADFLLYGVGEWSVHAWMSRYGIAVGLGRRLSRPR